MIIAWKVTVNKVVVFSNESVLACYDYCVANKLDTKIVKPIFKKEAKLDKLTYDQMDNPAK